MEQKHNRRSDSVWKTQRRRDTSEWIEKELHRKKRKIPTGMISFPRMSVQKRQKHILKKESERRGRRIVLREI